MKSKPGEEQASALVHILTQAQNYKVCKMLHFKGIGFMHHGMAVVMLATDMAMVQEYFALCCNMRMITILRKSLQLLPSQLENLSTGPNLHPATASGM